ncbi:hypothetical protein ACFZDK_24340 [Streptomyces sp. NPDC007901]|uniref:hypothetical protein n=1 Tax=Streptomyces sp. NPDC007901 TaxID=3364785 RepID=UPI0036EFFB9A
MAKQSVSGGTRAGATHLDSETRNGTAWNTALLFGIPSVPVQAVGSVVLVVG